MAVDAPEVDVNTDDLAEFEALLSGKAVEKEVQEVESEKDESEVAAEDADTEDNPEEAAPEEEPENQEEDEDEEDILAPKPKAKKTARERIDELTAEKYAEKRRADELERRLADIEAKIKTPEPKQDVAPVSDAPDPDAVDKNGELIYPLGEFDPAYIKALARHTIAIEAAELRKQQEAERREAEERAAATKLQTEWQDKLAKAEEGLSDLRENIANLEGTFANLDPEYGTYLAQTIMGLDHGPEILYYLSNNLDEAKRIVESGQTKATIALGKLEARIEGALVKKAQTPRVPKAPPPPVPVRGTAARQSVTPDTDDLEAFERAFYRKK